MKYLRGGGKWFVSCIMLYYVVLYFVKKYAQNRPAIPFAVLTMGVMIWYFFEDSSHMFMYGNNYFKWLFFFFFTLIGAYVGNNTIKLKPARLLDICIGVIYIILFYGIQFFARSNVLISHLQILSLLPLMGITISVYKLCCLEKSVQLLNSKIGVLIKVIAGLCLESYIVQRFIIDMLEERLSFPLNILICVIMVLTIAYITRCFGRFFTQTFEREDYNWKAVFSIF